MIARYLTRIPRATRGFATIANNAIPASLHLKTGQTFSGRAFGAPRSIWGETVFSTSITSCKLGLVLIMVMTYDSPYVQTPNL